MSWFSRGKALSLVREYDYDPFDLAVAAYRVIVRRYGEPALFGSRGLLQSRPLPLVSVNIGPREETRGIRGGFRIKHALLKGAFSIGENFIYYVVKEQFQQEAERFLDAVQEELDKNSIYRGKAFTLDREFLELNNVSLDNVVFNPKTEALLKAQIWALIEQHESCAAMNVYPQRKVLFCGSFGSGKTLAALLTAKKAVLNNWTVVYMPPTDKRETRKMELGLQVVRKYQPAIFIMEDIDHEQRTGDPFVFRQVLSNMDGILSKGTKAIIIMTTNFKSKIAGGLLRPGRIDQIIEFGTLGREETKKLIQRCIPGERLAADMDWDEVHRACSLYPPAFVKEMATSAALQAVAAGTNTVTQEMLVEAAKNLNFQYEECEKALQTGQYL